MVFYHLADADSSDQHGMVPEKCWMVQQRCKVQMQCTSATVHTCKMFAITVIQIALHVCSCDRHAPLSACHSWSAFHMCEHLLRRIWLCILHTCTSAHCNAEHYSTLVWPYKGKHFAQAQALCVFVLRHIWPLPGSSHLVLAVCQRVQLLSCNDQTDSPTVSRQTVE